MASVTRVDGKNGPSFKITVTQGRDRSGKQVRHYKTWTPAPGMTERQMQKAVQKAALEFEQSIELGYQADNRQTFAEYAAYVLDLKLRTGKLKIRTFDRYLGLLERITSVTTTESFYSHIIEESKAQAAECLADVMLRRKHA